MTAAELEVIESMERWGGSFVQALATAFRKADQQNFLKLREAFDGYWKQYEQKARQLATSGGGEPRRQ